MEVTKLTNNEKYHLAIDKLIEPVAERGNVMVRFEYIGEGECGDYTGEEDDVPMMRFYTFKRIKDTDPDGFPWEEVEDGSYCTQVPVDTPNEILEKLVWILFDRLEDAVNENRSVKKIGEELSWIDKTWIK